VYVRPPKILAHRFGSKIIQLSKALYGLKQDPLSWHLHLEKIFNTVNIIKAPTPCLYAYNNCTILVYVDDLIISGPSVEEVTKLCCAMLRMRPLSISSAKRCVVISCRKVDYDKSG
jgi:Reverse transcriptase (RNA-dependent DNA polymerase)